MNLFQICVRGGRGNRYRAAESRWRQKFGPQNCGSEGGGGSPVISGYTTDKLGHQF